jgi:hypothetical protein
MSWYTEGAKSNPAANTVLADTGALTGGNKTIIVLADCNVAADVTIEHRNDSNTSTIESQQISILANGTISITLPYGTLTFATDERLRVIVKSTITLGTAQASILIG